MSTKRVRLEELAENLEAIFERVLAGDEIVVERADGEVVTLTVGARNGALRRGKNAKDLAAFRSAAGSWSDVDTDTLIRDIYASRGRSSRPPVEL